MVQERRRLPGLAAMAKWLHVPGVWRRSSLGTSCVGRRECTACGRQSSVTAGTIFHKSRTPLTVWFVAAWLLTSQKSGASALGLQRVLGIGSYQTAGAMLHRLRSAMVSWLALLGRGANKTEAITQAPVSKASWSQRPVARGDGAFVGWLPRSRLLGSLLVKVSRGSEMPAPSRDRAKPLCSAGVPRGP